MGYQVGVTPLQMAAAVSSVANGGTLVRAARRPRGDQGRPASRRSRTRCCAARCPTGDRGDAHRRSWSRSSSAAPATAAKIDGFTVAGKTGTAQKLVNGRYSRLGLQRLVRRVRSVAQAGAHDRRRHRLAARQRLLRRHGGGADLQADRRGVAASSRHRRRRSTPPPPVLVARNDRRGAARRSRCVAATVDSPVNMAEPPPCRRDARPARAERARGAPHADPARPDRAESGDGVRARTAAGRRRGARPASDAAVLTLGRRAGAGRGGPSQ